MAIHDLDKANAVHDALLALLNHEPGGRDNPAVLSHVEALCDAAVDAVNDVEGRIAIRGVKSLAALLYSDDGHIDAAMAGLRGTEAIRLKMVNALSAFRGRIEGLENRKPSRPEIPAVAARHLQILVVEDNRDSAESLRRLLEITGYSVTVAGTAMEGLESAKRVRPDVVLCDIGLPDSNGFALAEALHEHPNTARARLIALTAYGDDEAKERSKRAGFDLHLVKPVYPGTILQVLEDTKRRPQSDNSVAIKRY